MSTQLTLIPLKPISVYGFVGGGLIPLVQYNCLEGENRQEVIDNILLSLSTEDKVIISNTLIFTESYDAFKVL